MDSLRPDHHPGDAVLSEVVDEEEVFVRRQALSGHEGIPFLARNNIVITRHLRRFVSAYGPHVQEGVGILALTRGPHGHDGGFAELETEDPLASGPNA